MEERQEYVEIRRYKEKEKGKEEWKRGGRGRRVR